MVVELATFLERLRSWGIVVLFEGVQKACAKTKLIDNCALLTTCRRIVLLIYVRSPLRRPTCVAFLAISSNYGMMR